MDVSDDPELRLGALLKSIEGDKDRVIVLNMHGHRGHARELAMAVAKLDEARAWLLLYGERTNQFLFVDKEQYRENLDHVAATAETG